MLPNYILVFIFAVFLIYSYINIKVKKAKVSNGCLYGIGIVVAVLLLGMSIYGIIFNIPLGQVQMLIENSFNIWSVWRLLWKRIWLCTYDGYGILGSKNYTWKRKSWILWVFFFKKCKKIIRVCKVHAWRKQFDAFGR